MSDNPFEDEIALFETSEGGTSRMAVPRFERPKTVLTDRETKYQ